jgi:signal transduction histidine kinase/ligand-binding sensor protein
VGACVVIGPGGSGGGPDASIRFFSHLPGGEPAPICTDERDSMTKRRSSATVTGDLRVRAEKLLGDGGTDLRPMSPDAAIIDEDLRNILDAPAIQSLMEDFTKLTNMVMAILDLKGNVLVATGWQDICTQYHRVHPQTAQNCTESDLFLAQNLRPGEYVAYKCKNHLWDVATPLFIGGKHVGNIYTGQFFYDDEAVDDRLFIDQAAKYGFDQEAYMSALQRVPRLSRDRVKTLMDFLTKFSALISKLSYSNLKLAQAMSEQQRIEAVLRQSEELYRYLFENMLNGFAYCKMLFYQNQPQEYIYLKVNSSFEQLTGLKNVVGKKVSEVIPGIRESDPELLEAYGRVALTGKSERFETYVEALKMWFSISVYSPEKEYFVTIFDVITERKRAEAEIVRKSDQLQALAARLTEVEEAERQHLARQLHDQVCQSLTALGLTLTLLQTQMPRKAAAALRGRLADALTLVEQTGETIRNVMVELRPPMLDDYGLLSALNWYGVEFFAKTGISVEVQGQEAAPRLAAPVELALFRIVQEAMTNVAKHARATRVLLTEAEDNGTVQLVIADNGVGFDQERLGQPEGRHLWGIMTMSERAAGAGGCCRIESQPGQGTRVVVEVSR